MGTIKINLRIRVGFGNCEGKIIPALDESFYYWLILYYLNLNKIYFLNF